MRARHLEGLFGERTWHETLRSAGFAVDTFDRPIGSGDVDRIFLCRR